MSRSRVLVKEAIASAGIDLLRERFDVDVELEMGADQLLRALGGYDALIVRSATKVTADVLAAGRRLKVVGRAGTGVDNVDVAEATRRGIIVANAPGSNMVSAAEHAIGLLLAVARNIPQADASLRAGRWERSRLAGVELDGKTLAVVGFGRIGQLVASRARGLGMRVVAFDPFVAPERMAELQVVRAGTLAEALAEADFVTLHAPLSDETRRLVRAETIALMRPGARLVNAARGGLVDLDDLVAALRDGRLAAAALDVFPTEPYTSGEILELPNVVVTPHLGASTREAQDRAGVIVAEEVAAALSGGLVRHAVNVPQVGAEDLEQLAPFLPLASQLGRLAVGLADDGLHAIHVTYSGAIAELDTRLVTAAVLEGALSPGAAEPVNLVNAPAVAETHGIAVREARSSARRDFTNLITVETAPGAAISGTTIGGENRPWLVEVGGRQLEIELDRCMLVLANDDRPGMVGAVGTMLGADGVNIANMNVSRGTAGDAAAMVLSLDTRPSPGTLERLRGLEGVHAVRFVSLAHG